MVVPSFVFAGDEKYHADEDEKDSGPEENAHDATRNEPVATYEPSPQCVADCATHEHPNIVCRSVRYVIVTSSTT